MYESERNAPPRPMIGLKRWTIETIEYALTPIAPR